MSKTEQKIEDAISRIRGGVLTYLHQIKGKDDEDPFVQDIAAIDTLLAAYEASQQDVKRMNMAQRLLHGYDFSYSSSQGKMSVVVLRMPPRMAVGADLRQFLDDAGAQAL